MSNIVADSIRLIAPKYTVDINTVSDVIAGNGKSYEVNNEKRLEAFIAQAAHETAGFTSFEENASGAAYEGRADLGNTQPGDGIKFKGRGIFMITGRSNYQAVSRAIFKDDRLLNNPELLEKPEYATISALYFWKSRNLGPLADAGDFEGITKRINGGLNGWADRLNYYEKIKIYLTNSNVKSFWDDTKGVFIRNPEVSIVTGLTVLGIAGYYIYRAAKLKK